MEWNSILETKTISKQVVLTEGQELTAIKTKLIELGAELPDLVPPKTQVSFDLSITVITNKK